MGADRASVAEAPADRAAPDGRSAECPLRFLPNDFPPLSTVPRYFYDWRDGGLLRTINNHLVMAVRDLEGREASPTAGVIDSQFEKSASVAVRAGWPPRLRTPILTKSKGWGNMQGSAFRPSRPYAPDFANATFLPCNFCRQRTKRATAPRRLKSSIL